MEYTSLYSACVRAGRAAVSAVVVLVGVLPAWAQSSAQYPSDLPWVLQSNGWGPVERDRSNGEDQSGDGSVLTLNGATFDRGLGTHAPSRVVLNVPAGCTSFNAAVGVDDEVGSDGSVVFQVVAGGTVLYDSGTMTGASATKTVAVDISGKSQVELVLNDGGDGINFDHGDWANARFGCAAASSTNVNPNVIEFRPAANHFGSSTTSTVYVSDLTWVSSSNGWGPAERDGSNGEDSSGDGAALTMSGMVYAKGLGVHAPSNVTVNVPTGCTTFAAEIGVDDEVGSYGSVLFEVKNASGVVLYSSGRMDGTSATRQISIPVSGQTRLQLLVTDTGDGMDFDHADWGSARFGCSSTGPTLSRYDVAFYQAGTLDPFMVVGIGKPQPQSDGLIRLDISELARTWPMPNVLSEARVIAVNTSGPAVSVPSNTFIYPCDLALATSSASVSAAGGSGSVGVTSTTACGWTANSSSGWITITSPTSGSGTGTVGYSVARNTATTPRTGTLTIGNLTYTINQAAALPAPPPPPANVAPTVAITSPANDSTVRRNRTTTLSATASDRDGQVVAVRFLVNGVLVASSAGPSFSANWRPAATGTHVVTAVAVDNAGATTTSAPVSVVVR